MSTSPAPVRSWWSRASWVLVLVLGIATYVAEQQVMLATRNPNLFPSLLLLGAAVVPMTVLAYAATSSRTALAPSTWVAVSAFFGGVVGTLSAGVLEYDVLTRLGVGSMLAVGVIEEATKLVVPLVVLLLVGRWYPFAGVVLGVASGAGFATLETMGYGFTALLASRGDVLAAERTLQLRALLAPAGHVAWTGVAAAALAAALGAREPGRRSRATRRFAWTFVAVVLLHAAWDGLPSTAVRVAVAVVSVGWLLLVVHRPHVAARGAEPMTGWPPGASYGVRA
ncbi:PrsW family intramembrane metalloprotease [Lapillicoccus jejuensis]|uniref:RsiW-degrading membrane proteinase PrsW (M82 family) n=1 Tax=Lapillicoccus jejuensis TaxID=402171 RepID=A0A542E0T0_9MICO|nr:PrsW family glutamic-type intramembrane protease [Lapillicoccus jejuensis]TQJ08804.1 RsiW-degrading membrane proteinase PrsW (M82 family) [Lapillicoccus jejuensis]